MGTLNKSEADRMKTLLMEAVTTLCRSGIRFEEALRVEGLIAVTVDESDIIVVNVNKTFENPNAAAKKAAAAKAEAEKLAAAENNTDSGGDLSDGGTPRRRRRRKKRRSGAGSEGSDNEELNAQADNVETGNDTPSKRLRGDSETGWSHGESSLDSSHQGNINQTRRDHGADSMHAIKIEIDTDSEQEDDKDQLAAQLFGAGGDNSLIAVPLDQSGIDGMGSPMPVSMFSASSLPGTSTMNFPSATSAATYQELSPGTFASPQEGSSKPSEPHEPRCTCCKVWRERLDRQRIHTSRYQNKNNPAVLQTLPDLQEPVYRRYRPPPGHQALCGCCTKIIKRLESNKRAAIKRSVTAHAS